jgi:hypothetical protein
MISVIVVVSRTVAIVFIEQLELITVFVMYLKSPSCVVVLVSVTMDMGIWVLYLETLVAVL